MSIRHRLKRFSVLGKLYKGQEEKLALKLKETLLARNQEQEQLDTLDGLIEEYQNSATHKPGESGLPGLMRIQRQFLNSLGHMRANQADSAENAQQRSELARTHFLHAKQKTDAINLLQNKMRLEIRQKQTKKEQRDLDELSSHRNYSAQSR